MSGLMVGRVMHRGGEASRDRIGNEDALGWKLKMNESDEFPRISALVAVSEK